MRKNQGEDAKKLLMIQEQALTLLASPQQGLERKRNEKILHQLLGIKEKNVETL